MSQDRALVSDYEKFDEKRRRFYETFSQHMLSKVFRYRSNILTGSTEPLEFSQSLSPIVNFSASVVEGAGSAMLIPGSSLAKLPFAILNSGISFLEKRGKKAKQKAVLSSFGENLESKPIAHQMHELKSAYETLGVELSYIYEQQLRRLTLGPRGVERFAEYAARLCLSAIHWYAKHPENIESDAQAVGLDLDIDSNGFVSDRTLLLLGMTTLENNNWFQYRGGELHFKKEKLETSDPEVDSDWTWNLFSQAGVYAIIRDNDSIVEKFYKSKLKPQKINRRGKAKYYYRAPVYYQLDQGPWEVEDMDNETERYKVEKRENLEGEETESPLYLNVFVEDVANYLAYRQEGGKRTFNGFLGKQYRFEKNKDRPVIAILRQSDLCNSGLETLKGADFSGSVLMHVDFSTLDLTGVKFDDCFLQHAKFNGAKLGEGTSFKRSDLRFADFKGASFIHQADGYESNEQENGERSIDFSESKMDFSDISGLIFDEQINLRRSFLNFAIAEGTEFKNIQSLSDLEMLQGNYEAEDKNARQLNRLIAQMEGIGRLELLLSRIHEEQGEMDASLKHSFSVIVEKLTSLEFVLTEEIEHLIEFFTRPALTDLAKYHEDFTIETIGANVKINSKDEGYLKFMNAFLSHETVKQNTEDAKKFHLERLVIYFSQRQTPQDAKKQNISITTALKDTFVMSQLVLGKDIEAAEQKLDVLSSYAENYRFAVTSDREYGEIIITLNLENQAQVKGILEELKGKMGDYFYNMGLKQIVLTLNRSGLTLSFVEDKGYALFDQTIEILRGIGFDVELQSENIETMDTGFSI